MEKLKGIHAGQVVWIIGRGPSLQYLVREDIGLGPIIALNQAILKIEEFDFPNPVYYMHKDGGVRKRSLRTLSPDCDYTPNCGDRCGHMFRPLKGATLLVHRLESLYCFPDYAPRHVFDVKELGLPGNEFSLIVAVKIGQFMGCTKFNFVSCDVHVNGDIRTFIPSGGLILTRHDVSRQVERLKPHLKGLDCGWITLIPRQKEDLHESSKI